MSFSYGKMLDNVNLFNKIGSCQICSSRFLYNLTLYAVTSGNNVTYAIMGMLLVIKRKRFIIGYVY